jgi:anaerobic selenocysteine-containing dehydrogenase
MDKEWKKVLDDGTEVIRTSAWSPPGCHPVGCGLRLFVKDGKLVKVEGDPQHPLTKGRTCIRCLTLPEYTYNKDRIIHPMKRDPAKRGQDAWERISWDEALDLATSHIKETQEKYGLEGTMLFFGTGRQAAVHGSFQAGNVLQTPNICYPFSGYSCYGPRIAVTAYVVGAGVPEMDYASGFPDQYDDPRYELPKYVLVWGKNPLISNPDGLWGHCLIELMKRGTELIVVDPRMTWLATRAKHVLRLRPGTDAALALGILNVIINEDLYDHDFVSKWCYGFDELKERVQQYPLDRVEKICDVPADKIREAARAMAQTPVSMTWGLPVDESNNGVQTGQALLSIQAICGNLDVPGGTVLGPVAGFGAADDQGRFPTVTPEEVTAKRIGRDKYPGFDRALNTVQPDYLLECLEADEPYPIRFAWIQSSNFLSPTCSVQPERWKRAMQKMDYTMATDTFMNPTIMACADLFLPLSTFAEAKGLVFNHYGMNTTVVSAINKAITTGETKGDVEIGFELAKRLHPTEYPQSVDELVDGYFDGMAGASRLANWSELQTVGSALVPTEYRKYEKGMLRPDGKPGFSTPTGRIELYSTTYEFYGEDPLPYYEEPHMSPSSTPQFDFILTTGARRYTSFHSEHRQVATLRHIDPDPMLEMNPNDAARLNVEADEWVEIYNDLGHARFKVQITPIIKQGVVHAQHAWWFPEEEGAEPNLFGVWKSNVNSMCPSGDNSVMGFGAPLKCLMCNVRKLDEKEAM